MIRNSCILCKNTEFEKVCSLDNYPSSFSPGIEEDYKNDILTDLVFKGCTSCGCVQLETLIDPNILYQGYHNETSNTPTWKQHHDLFSSFFLSRFEGKRVLELGGYTGVLAKKILDKISCEYTILDIVKKNPNHTGIQYISENCEEFTYHDEKTVIMSHIFEHIYNPIEFIKRLSDHGVQDIYISLPNMSALLERRNICILQVEHTFYIDEHDIKSMFSKEGFVCSSQEYFKNHSIFFHFQKHSQCLPYTHVNKERLYQQKEICTQIDSVLSSIEVKQPCFIAPAGHYGQKIYYYLQRYSENIIGFLDNDPCKIGNRVYGTPKLVFNPSELTKYVDQLITIVLFAGPYKDEIKKQYTQIHPNIEFIDLNI